MKTTAKKVAQISKAIDNLQKAKMALGVRDKVAIEYIEKAQKFLLEKY